MAILTTALAALLILAGLGMLAMSIDLIPTELGLFYGTSGVILVSAGAVVLAIAALIARLNSIVAPKPAPPAPLEPAPPAAVEPAIAEPPHEVRRYVVRGTEYAIFSDGSIEAQTDEGRLRFASMAEFRAYLEPDSKVSPANPADAV
jgi:hypothetical protein